MLSLIFYILAGILFALAGFNEPIFKQPELDEIAFGLLFVVLANLLSGWGPPNPWRGPPA